MHEDLEDVFNDDFVAMMRAHWIDWAVTLSELPPHYSARFVQTQEDVTELYNAILRAEKKLISPYGPLCVIANTLAHLYTRPAALRTPAGLQKIKLITEHELVPSLVQLIGKQFLYPDKFESNMKLICYALFSIANNSVRVHVVEEGNVPLLLSMLQNPSVFVSHAECVVQVRIE